MFLDEARIVARIRSPHVVATLDIIEEGDTLYQVMEYANGPALSAVLKAMRPRDERVPVPLVLAIMADALEGLHAAHEVRDDQGAPLNVVHRDVSPHNILVTEDGIAKVIDFGIASAAGKLHHTQPGNVKGKIGYMSPEQLDGRRADRRADIYAAGVVLYEALTGQRPFGGQDLASAALLHLTAPAPDPRVLRAEIMDELAAIVDQALAKRPQDRFSTARAMADALLALPSRRAPPREVAEWLADTSREFFVERRALVAALPLVEGEATTTGRSEPVGPNDEATRAERETASKPKEKAPENERSRVARRSRGRLAVVFAAGILAVALSLVALGRKTATPQPTAALPEVAIPTPTAAPVAPPVPPTPVFQSVPAVDPSAVPPAARTTSGRPRSTSRPAVSTTLAPAQDPCCSGDLRLRLSNCVDNCPPARRAAVR